MLSYHGIFPFGGNDNLLVPFFFFEMIIIVPEQQMSSVCELSGTTKITLTAHS
jgi:hypothetical protein